jgi:hypothetical protein
LVTSGPPGRRCTSSSGRSVVDSSLVAGPFEFSPRDVQLGKVGLEHLESEFDCSGDVAVHRGFGQHQRQRGEPHVVLLQARQAVVPLLDHVDPAPDRPPLLGPALEPAQPLDLALGIARVAGLVAGEDTALGGRARGEAWCETGESLGDVHGPSVS